MAEAININIEGEELTKLEQLFEGYDYLVEKAESYNYKLHELNRKRKAVNDELKLRKRLNRLEAERIHEIREARNTTPYLNKIYYDHVSNRNTEAKIYSFSDYHQDLTEEVVDEELKKIVKDEEQIEYQFSLEQAKDLVRFMNELRKRIENNFWASFPLTKSQSHRLLKWFEHNWDLQSTAIELNIDKRSLSRGLFRTLEKLDDSTIVSHLRKILYSIPLEGLKK
jgi:hypothetical protein